MLFKSAMNSKKTVCLFLVFFCFTTFVSAQKGQLGITFSALSDNGVTRFGDEIIDDSKSKEIQENVEKICDEIKNLKDADIQKKLKTKKKREMFLEKIMSIEEDIKLYQKDKKK